MLATYAPQKIKLLQLSKNVAFLLGRAVIVISNAYFPVIDSS